jgi:hypothetical protein
VGFEGVEDCALRHRARDVQRHLAINPRQCLQMCWEYNSDHFISVSWFVKDRFEQPS